MLRDELSYEKVTEKEYEEDILKANTGDTMREVICPYQNEDFNSFDSKKELDIYIENKLIKKREEES